MANLNFEVTSYQCSVELTVEDFKKLQKIDYLEVVMPKLGNFGARDIDYNGHFGAAVYFTCDNLQKAKEITEEIEKIIQSIKE